MNTLYFARQEFSHEISKIYTCHSLFLYEFLDAIKIHYMVLADKTLVDWT